MQGHQGCQRDQQHYGWPYQQGQFGEFNWGKEAQVLDLLSCLKCYIILYCAASNN